MSHVDVPRIIRIDEARLRAWPLPATEPEAREVRGRVIVIGGSAERPGPVILAATAALCVGARELVVATLPEITHVVAAAVPEARVVALPVAFDDALDPAASRVLEGAIRSADAVLVGPGMQGEARARAFVRGLLPMLRHVTVVLSGCTMGAAKGEPNDPIDAPRVVDRPLVLTPTVEELAELAGLTRAEVLEDAPAVAASLARRWDVVVALDARASFVATPRGLVFELGRGDVSFMGPDAPATRAGFVVGLAARGATADQASVWGASAYALSAAS